MLAILKSIAVCLKHALKTNVLADCLKTQKFFGSKMLKDPPLHKPLSHMYYDRELMKSYLESCHFLSLTMANKTVSAA